ncbi:hypothetical protein [Streptomyces sp. NPDC048269]|uniref:hypothetical protein n=1 Tax=Streptomyces sp. NPDC048269 TaxID=3155753 RepID=UPI003412A5E5
MVDDVCSDYTWPVAHGLPFGHTPLQLTLPIGAVARLDAEAAHPLTLTSPWTAPRSPVTSSPAPLPTDGRVIASQESGGNPSNE